MRTDAERRRAELRWGLAAIGGALVLVAAIGVVYLTGTTPERTYSADLAQAGSIRPGDDVRVAGVPVGKVKSLTLQPDRVRMTFTVSDEVSVGDATTLDIRMLTVVGGYYLAVQPAGAKPLGSAVIPQDRVTIPYNLTQAFQDAVQPVQQLDGGAFRKDLAALATSIDASPDAVRTALRAAGDLVAIMDKQNADISGTLSIADEYLAALNANSAVVLRFLNSLRSLESLVQNNKTQVRQSLEDLAAVLHGFAPFGRVWDETLKQRVQPLADAVPKLEELGTQLGALLDSLRSAEQRLLPYLPPDGGVTVDQSGTTIQPSAVCVPVPGGGC
ncbi:phospholipid/cholesterol/gamma-HCH transport system substrate-binding protein [Nocardia transvalensis]|uniref:Phospholipid/cholesterol/gamma-HCH transport system substrate-binding protein n=1 Tax=Nocardia transvalensis TaxID=37333 RepID=A0A7W9UM52_9NOCA|nr:MlaD family protein [Nocardia transvalensis]MBB5918259.1 phospholipid/cholesterol/gamma-HCH transport system substrate-binding protein [Nocardia transvalensis]